MANDQLTLLDDRVWKLDRRTREVGKQGIAEARAALRRAMSGNQPQSTAHKAA
ncbi:MAG: hypothetical protein JF603_06210 [Acidobacteria bacterium]|nr:hypothetical protein [Acidobacteriota bacterium]